MRRRVEGDGFQPKTAQDAHTIWEQNIYEALWRSGSDQPDGSRVVCAGYSILARMTRLAVKTVKRNLESLRKKLAVEPIAAEIAHTSTGRTYRVYSFRQILQRRRTSGLNRVLR